MKIKTMTKIGMTDKKLTKLKLYIGIINKTKRKSIALFKKDNKNKYFISIRFNSLNYFYLLKWNPK